MKVQQQTLWRKTVEGDLARFILRPSTKQCGRRYPARAFHTSPLRRSYEDTIQNLKVGKDTRVIFQGFTGKQATQNAQESLAWGTKIVGGVRPGKDGEHLGLPVLPSVRAAKEQLKPDASAVYVAAHQAAGAIEEAIEAEIPLIVAVAEHIPLHDMIRVQQILRSQSKSRLVGANSPGLTSAVGRCRLGFHPLPTFSPGCIGIVAKSGTLSYETIASTTKAGLGQSLVIGMGGDPLPGTDFVDSLKVLEHDEDTKGIIMVGEIGGDAEIAAAEWIKDYRQRVANPKPIMALVGGVQAPRDRVMGHAGARVRAGEKDARGKIRALEKAGAIVTNHPTKFGEAMKGLLQGKGPYTAPKMGAAAAGQARSYHTQRRPVTVQQSTSARSQRRSLYIPEGKSFDVLRQKGVSVPSAEDPDEKDYFLTVTLDRKSFKPAVITSYSIGGESAHNHAEVYPLNLYKGSHIDPQGLTQLAEQVLSDFNVARTSSGLPESAVTSVRKVLSALIETFFDKEAFSLTTRIARNANGQFEIARANFEFDDAAHRISRQPEVFGMRDTSKDVPEEVDAEKDGFIYVKLPGEGILGTVVNGAGLAMNTVDAVTDLGGKVANFLDSGGKATKETIKSAFGLVLRDQRVKAIFVNIFGGITRCDMIAEGVMLAYQDLGIKLPVVIRLKGTNEAEGQKKIADSGLRLFAYDDFEEAAKKAIELSEQ